jgi:3-hydroxyacyl-[acyl-carrier-protein] dehydratase
LIDRIEELNPGKQITGVKIPTLSEEYLQDHFPLFPVMPGVLMLEAMYQAAAWLLRHKDDFAYSMVMLKEARNVKYVGLVQPGQVLQITADLQKENGSEATFKTKGVLNDETVVSARVILEKYNLADRDPEMSGTDTNIRQQMRHDFKMLFVNASTPVTNTAN